MTTPVNAYTCPNCGAYTTEGRGRTCRLCGYRGDWIQPGHKHLYLCPDWNDFGRPEVGREGECICEKLVKTGGLQVIKGGKR